MSFFNTIKTENIRLEFQDLNHDIKDFYEKRGFNSSYYFW